MHVLPGDINLVRCGVGKHDCDQSRGHESGYIQFGGDCFVGRADGAVLVRGKLADHREVQEQE